MKSKESFELFAKQYLKKFFNTPDHERIFKHLCIAEEKLAFIDRDKFALEYLAFSLAVASLAWMQCLTENGIDDESIKKIFLKNVMGFFQSPKFVDLAGAYSHYVYAPASPEKVLVPLAESFLKRIGIEFPPPEDISSVPPVLSLLAEITEGYRAEFEAEFTDFFESGDED